MRIVRKLLCEISNNLLFMVAKEYKEANVGCIAQKLLNFKKISVISDSSWWPFDTIMHISLSLPSIHSLMLQTNLLNLQLPQLLQSTLIPPSLPVFPWLLNWTKTIQIVFVGAYEVSVLNFEKLTDLARKNEKSFWLVSWPIIVSEVELRKRKLLLWFLRWKLQTGHSIVFITLFLRIASLVLRL